MSDGTQRWEIAQRGFGDGWYRLGTSEGTSPVDALRTWIENRDTRFPGTYGVRKVGETEWQPFRVDANGQIHSRVDLTA